MLRGKIRIKKPGFSPGALFKIDPSGRKLNFLSDLQAIEDAEEWLHPNSEPIYF